MKRINITQILLAAMLFTLGSCRHKELWNEENPRVSEKVVFDWSKAPDADPSSMMTYFFPEQDSEESEPLVYTFAGREGGTISIPYDNYVAISLNGDNSHWASLRNTDDPERFEVYTKDAEQLSGYGMASRSLPRAEGAENERMAMTPDMIWSDRRDDISVTLTPGEQQILFYPEENVCHYSVLVKDVSNMEYIHGVSIDATLSGMAEGYLHGGGKTTDVAVTMPFILSPTHETNSLHSEFLTFGECDSLKVKHLLTVYMYLSDGSKRYRTYDVTDQVTAAPDPRHVQIVVSGLEVPKPVAGGGFNPDVSDWKDIGIDLKM